jgi:7-carboxy-7-deazaguanine synthase
VPSVLFVSEIFDSLQGEGPSQGQPCSFLRLAGCNLTCSWCDTDYSWNWRKYRVREETKTYPLAALVERFATTRRLVITGGEPLLQQRALSTLLASLPPSLVVEVETNGTIAPAQALLERVDQWNVSPKLSHGGDPEHRRIVPGALAALLGTGRAWLKLVVANSGTDLSEVSRLVAVSSWPQERIFLMPECRNASQLQAATPALVDACISHGYSFSSRLHLTVWSGKRGH